MKIFGRVALAVMVDVMAVKYPKFKVDVDAVVVDGVLKELILDDGPVGGLDVGWIGVLSMVGPIRVWELEDKMVEGVVGF